MLRTNCGSVALDAGMIAWPTERLSAERRHGLPVFVPCATAVELEGHGRFPRRVLARRRPSRKHVTVCSVIRVDVVGNSAFTGPLARSLQTRRGGTVSLSAHSAGLVDQVDVPGRLAKEGRRSERPTTYGPSASPVYTVE